MNMKDLYDVFSKIKFHHNEWRDFLLASVNFKAYKEDKRPSINKRKCPVLFMNYKSEDGIPRERSTLKGSRSVNPHVGKNSEYNKENASTYNLFPGDRLIHYDFLTAKVAPNSEKAIGEIYPTLQVHFFDRVHNKNSGDVIKNVPYFNIYPALKLWRDILKVE